MQKKKKKILCSDLGEQKHFSQGIKFFSTISSLDQLIHYWELSLIGTFLKCPMLQLIFSFLSVQISETISVITDTWDDLSVVDTLAHTDTHGCSCHLKASFALQLVTPRYIQIPLQSERWDVIKSWQQIFWCVRCAFTSGIWITQHSLQEWEEACTRKVSGCKVTWRKDEKENAIMMWTCTFLPCVSISMCYFLFPNHRTDS